MLKSARELQEPNVNLLVVRTKGDHFDLNRENGNASVGWWQIKADRPVDRVVIYLKPSKDDEATIYIADYVRKERRDGIKNRHKFYLANIQYLGNTTVNWQTFANDGKAIVSAIRYLSAAG